MDQALAVERYIREEQISSRINGQTAEDLLDSGAGRQGSGGAVRSVSAAADGDGWFFPEQNRVAAPASEVPALVSL